MRTPNIDLSAKTLKEICVEELSQANSIYGGRNVALDILGAFLLIQGLFIAAKANVFRQDADYFDRKARMSHVLAEKTHFESEASDKKCGCILVGLIAGINIAGSIICLRSAKQQSFT